jgi:hypothetical protein
VLQLRLLAAAGEVATLDAAAVLLGSPGGPCADAMPEVARWVERDSEHSGASLA